MNARVTFVCQWYPPEPAAIPESIVNALRTQGLSVEVLTGIPNYPSGVVTAGYRASRRSTETRDGIPVHRAPLYPSHDTSAVNRLLNYASWAVSSTVTGQLPLRRADANLVYSSPATAALPTMVAKVLWRTPYVLLIQDVWPDSIFASGFLGGRLSKVVYKIVDLFVRRAYAMSDHVAVISPGMKDLLVDRGVPSHKVSVVYNWLPEGDVSLGENDKKSTFRTDLGIPDDVKLFLYAGNHGRAQALEPLVRAFADPATEPAHLVMLGDGVSKPDLMSLGGHEKRTHFLDPVPRDQAVLMSRESDVHVVSLADEPLFAVTMPSKLQSGLAAGIPVLAVAPGDSAAVVTEEGAGVAARPGDVASVIEGVTKFNTLSQEALKDMGQRGREAYDRLMAREIGSRRLADLLERAAAPRPRQTVADNASVRTTKEKL